MMAVLVVIIIIYFEPIWKILDLFRLEFSHIMSECVGAFVAAGAASHSSMYVFRVTALVLFQSAGSLR